MRRFLLFLLTNIILIATSGQDFFSKNFLSSSLSQKKFVAQLNKNKFEQKDSRLNGDTLVTVYRYKAGKKSSDTTTRRYIETYQAGDYFGFAFFTTSPNEFSAHCAKLKEEGFFIGNETAVKGFLFQKETITVVADKSTAAEETKYSFRFNEAKLPEGKDIKSAEDLMRFNSHEELVAVFGEANVIKDVYFFSDEEVSKSSVVFPKTRHQAVFIWKDEENYRFPYYIMLGGNMNTKTVSGFNGLIEENVWVSNDGVYSGMGLADLLRLNGEDLKFYGRNSAFPFMVLPENSGRLNFKEKTVVLACLDALGTPLLNADVISAREILMENPGIYVFMVMLKPADKSLPGEKSVTSAIR